MNCSPRKSTINTSDSFKEHVFMKRTIIKKFLPSFEKNTSVETLCARGFYSWDFLFVHFFARQKRSLISPSGRKDVRKTNGWTDIWPKDKWPKKYMAERQMTEWTSGQKTSEQKDISPKGRMAEKQGEMHIWTKRYLTQ